MRDVVSMIERIGPEAHRSAGTLDLDQVEEAVICLDEEVSDVVNVNLALEHLDELAAQDPVVPLKEVLPVRLHEISLEHAFELAYRVCLPPVLKRVQEVLGDEVVR